MAPCHLIFLVTLQILRPVVTDERDDAWGGRGGDGRGGWEGGGVFGVRSISHWPVPTARASGKCSSPWTSSSPGTLRSEFGRGETQGRVLEGAACRPALLTCPSVLLQSGAMGGEPLNTFYTQLVLMPQVLQYVQYVLLGLGGLLLLVPVIYQLRSQVSRQGGRTLCSGLVGFISCTSSRSSPFRILL